MEKTRLNQNVLTAGRQPLFTRQCTANTIKQYSFSVLPEAVPVWTAGPQNRIQLTVVQAEGPLGTTILLSSNGGKQLFAITLTQFAATSSQSFPAAYRLNCGDSVYVRTAHEEKDCDLSGAISAAQVAVNGRSDFANTANAVGLANGQVATLNSALLVGTRGRIVLNYSLLPANYSQLQIESVVLKFYCRLSLTLNVGISTMTLCWRANSAADWIDLQQLSLSLAGTLDYLTTPLTQDITAQVLAAANPWEIIGTLQTSFVGSHTGLGLGNSIQLDAVEVEICAAGRNKITLCGFEM